MSGNYHNIYHKSRLKEFGQTIAITLLGVMVIFFKLVLDDIIKNYTDYYKSILFLFTIQFSITYFFRLIITSRTIHKIQNGKIGFKTILVGTNGEAVKIYNELKKRKNYYGNKIIGYVSIDDSDNKILENEITRLGKFDDLTDIILKNKIEEVIISIETTEHKELQGILNKLILTNVKIKILPSLFDIAYGVSKVDTLYDTLFVEIENQYLAVTQQNIKRVIDIVISLIAIIILMPVYVALVIGIKLSSKGPIFYLQERIGKDLKPFKIIKFRSMYIDAEKNGPALSSSNDPRITPFGNFLRKTRLDETPQFFNVLIGHMSLVGPRPERKYYIDQIVKLAPYYFTLLKVKPGITSLGQVKYGYAENVDQMLERLKYDLAYIKNISIYLDFKIMILTIKTIFEASGK